MPDKKADGLADPRLGKRIIAKTRLARSEARVERAIKAALAKQKAKAIATLRAQSLRAAAPPDAFGLDSWDSLITDDVLPIVGDVLNDQAQQVFKFLALPPETRNKILGTVDLGSRADSFGQKVTSIGPDIARRVTDELSIGMAKGEGVDVLTDRIDSVFDIGDGMAERIARTETHGAAEETTHASAKAISDAGYDITKEWVDTDDNRTRQTHAEADGQVVPIGEKFEVGGEMLDRPGDPEGSAENVVNCRCSTVFNMATNEDSDASDAESTDF